MTTGISVSHYELSKTSDNKRDFTNKNTDEKLRRKIAKSSTLQFLKKGVNAGLSMLSIGMTLKAFYTKK
jgi:hypothetical protein